MEAKTMDLNYLQKKISRVRKSCVTPQQKEAYYRYVKLYRELLTRYNNDFGYQVRFDFKLLVITSLLIALGIVVLGLYLSHLFTV